jgi:hypothetical protein
MCNALPGFMDGAEVPKEQWSEFLEQYALDHEGWIVDLEWPGDDAESSRETEHTLQAIETYLEEDEARIVVFLANRDSLVIEEPERILVTENEEWEDELIEFQTPDNSLCLHLRFPQTEAQLGMRDEMSSDADTSGLPKREPAPMEEEIWIDEDLTPTP